MRSFAARSLIAGTGILLAAVFACRGITDPPLPAGSERISPPPVFDLWWSQTETCSGLTGSIEDVEWYVVRGSSGLVVDGADAKGYWSAASNRIVLAASAALDGQVVRHEILHALLGVGIEGHPREAFLGRCGGVVDCGATCRTDAGPPQSINAPSAAPDLLELAAEVTPALASSSLYGGNFAVKVTARNPETHPVLLRLPPAGDGGPAITFSFRLEGTAAQRGWQVRAWDPDAVVFRAGEIKQYVFDMHIGDAVRANEVRPGSYRVDIGYGGRSITMPNALIVSP